MLCISFFTRPPLYLCVASRLEGTTIEAGLSLKIKGVMKQEHYIKVVNDVVQRMEKHTDVVMNVKQVAEYLGLSVGAVRKRCQRKQLPCHLNAKHLYFSKLEVDAALLNRK